MKNRIITNSFRTIKKSLSRFIPLFVMSFLGSLVLAGLQATNPDMLITLDNFLDKHNVYDIKIISTGGLTSDDIEALEKLDGIKNVEASYSIDKIIEDTSDDIILNITSLPKNINTLTLKSGKLPENNSEIVVEENFLKKTSYDIGSTIFIEDEALNNTSYTIVGTVKSGLYFNNDEIEQDRGTTTIGSGTINYYSYVLDESFNQDYYNYIYLTVDDGIEEITSKDKYLNLIENAISKLDELKGTREQARLDEIKKKAIDEIKKEEEKMYQEFSAKEIDFENARKSLVEAKNNLDLLSENLITYKNTLDNNKYQLENARKDYQNALSSYNINESDIETNINLLTNNILTLENTLKQLDSGSNEYNLYQNELQNLNATLNNLNILKITRETLLKNENDYNIAISNYYELEKSYQKGLNEYNNGLTNYNNGLSEYNKAKNDAITNINDAYLQIENIEKPLWYIQDRMDHQTYLDYIEDITSLNNLSKVFPLIFFAVAILVSLISMNRMVEEERVEIGTLKSLGFSNKYIMLKYLLFSSIATIFGGLLGGFVGILTLPAIIASIYGMLFNVPNFYVGLNLEKIMLGLIIALVCICGTTIFTVLKVVREKPSDLMRPKAPKSGKRIFLERITWFWKKISFSNKVTIRNLFRYKKRGLVTIIGISGCSALLLCGFGIRDGIVDIANMQFKETFTYDALVYVDDFNDSNILTSEFISEFVETENKNVKQGNISANLFVIENSDMSKILNLVDKNDKPLNLEPGKVIITDKFADLNNLKVGDKVNLIDDNNKTYSYEVSGIAKNYLMHYIYVDKETYMKENEYKTNVVYLNLNDLAKEKELKSNLLTHDEVLSVSFIPDLLKSTDNMLLSLNKVILIIIFLASSLSFVVLYNLSNINISERKREISTLKVLGFHDREVDRYITKENIIFTIFGIIIGFFLGYYLTRMVITTVEMEKARFIHDISLNSYLYTAIITIIFTLIVDFVTHFNLKKIDMIASLKSVD